MMTVLGVEGEDLSEDAELWRASGPHGPQFGMGAPPKPIDIMILSNLLYFGVSGILSWCRGDVNALHDGNRFHKNRAQLLYMAFQCFSAFGLLCWNRKLAQLCVQTQPLPHRMGYCTYNYLVYAVMNSNHFNTGMSLFIDIMIGGEGSSLSRIYHMCLSEL